MRKFLQLKSRSLKNVHARKDISLSSHESLHVASYWYRIETGEYAHKYDMIIHKVAIVLAKQNIRSTNVLGVCSTSLSMLTTCCVIFFIISLYLFYICIKRKCLYIPPDNASCHLLTHWYFSLLSWNDSLHPTILILRSFNSLSL